MYCIAALISPIWTIDVVPTLPFYVGPLSAHFAHQYRLHHNDLLCSLLSLAGVLKTASQPPNLTNLYQSLWRHSILLIAYTVQQYALYVLVLHIEIIPKIACFHYSLVPIMCALDYWPELILLATSMVLKLLQ